VHVFPDYQWQLRRAVVESPWLAVHLQTSGTRQRPFLNAPGDRTRVSSDEFVMYRTEQLKIVELWGTADNARLAIRGPESHRAASGVGKSQSAKPLARQATPSPELEIQRVTERRRPTRDQMRSTMMAPMIEPKMPAGCRKPSSASLWKSR